MEKCEFTHDCEALAYTLNCIASSLAVLKINLFHLLINARVCVWVCV